MKMYLVYQSDLSDILREEKCNIILTFASIKRGFGTIIPKGYPEVMIDSGGYQLQTGVKMSRTVSVTAYAAWLQNALPEHPEIVAYFNLDIINNTAETLRNQAFLESEGLKPLPVWHPGEGDDILERYAKRHEYIALGGLVSTRVGKLDIRYIFERVQIRYPSHKFHFLGIGLSSSVAFINLRPYSVDFSTWQTVFRYGNDLVWNADGLLHEKHMNQEWRDKIKTDRTFRIETVRALLRNLKRYGEVLDNYRGEALQSQMNLYVPGQESK